MLDSHYHKTSNQGISRLGLMLFIKKNADLAGGIPSPLKNQSFFGWDDEIPN